MIRAGSIARRAIATTKAATRERLTRVRQRVGDAADAVQDRAADLQGRISGTAQRVGENVSETAQRTGETVRETAQRTGEAVRETASRVGETVGHRAEMVQERAADVSNQARSEAERLAGEARWRAQAGVERTRQTFWETMEQNPLTLGAVVLIAGAAIGASIPSTEYENRLMGDTRADGRSQNARPGHGWPGADRASGSAAGGRGRGQERGPTREPAHWRQRRFGKLRRRPGTWAGLRPAPTKNI